MSVFPEPDAAGFFLPELPPSPYPGLRPFEKSEWPIFFGRERMTDEVIEQLLQRQLVVVHGASGDGKSSLVRAGVQARLEQQYARSGLRWRTCWMRPGSRPLANLADALVGLFADPAKLPWIDVRRALNRGGRAPESLFQLLALDETDRVCILFDQFEELFRFEREVSHEESSLLTDFLVGFQESPPPGMHVLVTMRSEFMGECARFDGLAETINRTQYLLPRMNIDDLLRAVREPAALYRGKVTERLAERLVADARDGQDELPLIQHGLSLLWQVGGPTADSERGPTLDLADYEAGGPLDRLLSEHADGVLNAAARDSAGQKIIEELFRALTDTTADRKAIRRPQSFRDLVAVTGATEDRLRSILEAFRQPGVSFITPYPPKPIDAETIIDVSHEALIRRWHKIADPQHGWLQQEINDGLMWRALLVEAESFKKNPKSLLSEAATEERGRWLEGRNEAWALRYDGDWPGVEDLLEASRREVERKQRQAEEDRQRERDEQERRTRDAEALAAANLRTAQRTMFGLVAAVLLTFAAAGFGFWAWHETGIANQKTTDAEQATIKAERHLDTAVEVVEGLLAQLPKLRDQGIRADQLKDILDNVVEKAEKLRPTAKDNLGLQQALANSLRETSQTLVELGDIRSALEKAEKARDIAEKLSKSAPHNDRWAQNLWKCHNQIGNVLQEQKKLDEAVRSYKDGLEIAKARAEKDRSKVGRQLDLLISDWTIGDMLEQQGKPDEALEYLTAALAIAKQHAGKDQSQTVLEYDRWRWEIDIDMGIGLAMRGKVDGAFADEAFAYLEEALAIAKDRAHTDPEWLLNALRTNLVISIMEPAPPGRRLMVDNAIKKSQVIESQVTAKASERPYDAKLQRDLAAIKKYLGDRLLDEKKFDDAAKYYTQARASRQTLAARDPSNMRWQRELGEIHDKIGDVRVKQEMLDEALASYKEGLAIKYTLAAKDPSNTDSQRALGWSDAEIGDVLKAKGDLDGALEAYRGSLAIAKTLAEKDGTNTQWQRVLGGMDSKIGYVLVKQDKLDDALAAYKEGLAVRQALVEKDKTNAQWQSDLAFSDDNIGYVLVKQNKLDDALAAYKEGLAIRQALAAKDPSDTDLQSDLAFSDDNIGDVLVKQDKLDEALAFYKEGLAIRQALAAKDPSDTQRQRDLSVSDDNIGAVLVKQDKLDEALASYKDGLAIRQALAAKDPSDTQLQRELRVSVGHIGNIADMFDMAGAFAKALETADLAISRAPDETWLYTNRAHALMFLGRVGEARALYLQHRGKQSANQKWEDAVRDDFAKLREKRLAHPLMDEIEKRFADKNDGSNAPPVRSRPRRSAKQP